MANEFVIADLHFGHKGILTKGREFPSIEAHDEYLIEGWNQVVRPNDKVRVLGDVALGRKHLRQMARLNGKKSLVGGNHDTHALRHLAPYFYAVYGTRAFDDLILSYIPIHPVSLLQRWLANVHGHVHARCVDLGARYFNVSAEVIEYTPLAMEEVRDRIRHQQGRV